MRRPQCQSKTVRIIPEGHPVSVTSPPLFQRHLVPFFVVAVGGASFMLFLVWWYDFAYNLFFGILVWFTQVVSPVSATNSVD